jgi:hypothetical protein
LIRSRMKQRQVNCYFLCYLNLPVRIARQMIQPSGRFDLICCWYLGPISMITVTVGMIHQANCGRIVRRFWAAIQVRRQVHPRWVRWLNGPRRQRPAWIEKSACDQRIRLLVRRSAILRARAAADCQQR